MEYTLVQTTPIWLIPCNPIPTVRTEKCHNWNSCGQTPAHLSMVPVCTRHQAKGLSSVINAIRYCRDAWTKPSSDWSLFCCKRLPMKTIRASNQIGDGAFWELLQVQSMALWSNTTQTTDCMIQFRETGFFYRECNSVAKQRCATFQFGTSWLVMKLWNKWRISQGELIQMVNFIVFSGAVHYLHL